MNNQGRLVRMLTIQIETIINKHFDLVSFGLKGKAMTMRRSNEAATIVDVFTFIDSVLKNGIREHITSKYTHLTFDYEYFKSFIILNNTIW